MSREVHLLVMIHGMWGTPDNLATARKIITEKPGALGDHGAARLDILVAQTNQQNATYDGIDWGGERVAEEVYARTAEIERDGTSKVTMFSVFGYSLGGLLGRYLLGILHARDFFKDVKPMNFTTFATPHIGVPQYQSLMSTVSASLCSKLLSRTGEQLYVVDKWGNEERPLLDVLADQNLIFWRALSLFPHLHIYANSVSDPTVPFVTAAIELEDPFVPVHTDEMEINLDPNYGALIESYKNTEPLVTSKYYIRSSGRSCPFLNLPLRGSFLFESILLLLTPVLIPAVLSLAVVRLLWDSRASRSRITLLETAANSHTKLINLLASRDATVVNLIDPAGQHEKAATPASAASRCPLARIKCDADADADARAHKHQGAQPVLTDAQKGMVHTLNAIPQLEKHYAFFHPVRNTHGLIVCRDAEEARGVGGVWEALMKKAEGVLRHWADGFVV